MSYYSINSILMLHYHHTLSDLEGMIPWERDLHLVFVEEYIKEQKD